MPRDFCLFCGQSLGAACDCSPPPSKRREAERLEAEHLAIYHDARPLAVGDLTRLIETGGSYVQVLELLRNLEHPAEVTKELAMRATQRGVVQLVYEKHVGTQLLFWPWA